MPLLTFSFLEIIFILLGGLLFSPGICRNQQHVIVSLPSPGIQSQDGQNFVGTQTRLQHLSGPSPPLSTGIPISPAVFLPSVFYPPLPQKSTVLSLVFSGFTIKGGSEGRWGKGFREGWLFFWPWKVYPRWHHPNFPSMIPREKSRVHSSGSNARPSVGVLEASVSLIWRHKKPHHYILLLDCENTLTAYWKDSIIVCFFL